MSTRRLPVCTVSHFGKDGTIRPASASPASRDETDLPGAYGMYEGDVSTALASPPDSEGLVGTYDLGDRWNVRAFQLGRGFR